MGYCRPLFTILGKACTDNFQYLKTSQIKTFVHVDMHHHVRQSCFTNCVYKLKYLLKFSLINDEAKICTDIEREKGVWHIHVVSMDVVSCPLGCSLFLFKGRSIHRDKKNKLVVSTPVYMLLAIVNLTPGRSLSQYLNP